MSIKNNKITFIFVLFFCFCIVSYTFSQPKNIFQKQSVYVPAYSSIYHSDLKWTYNLSITLSIHNVDIKNNIIITAIDYYNSSGKLIHRYINRDPLALKPFETYNLGIKETDKGGGIGANFIVTWHSLARVNSPVIETIMIGTKGQQGISFASRGVVIDISE